MITKNIITDSSFKNNLNINSVDGRKKYKGLPDSVAEKIKELARDGAKFTMNYDNTPLIDIYEGDTAVISYDAKNGGWRRSGMTKDEKAFDRDVTNLYLAEYRKTKEEMKNSQITTKTEISINISKTQSFSMSV